jgi:AraC-like DNA-binding protein
MIEINSVFHDKHTYLRGIANKRTHILVLQTKNKCQYTIEDNQQVILSKGDVLFVPQGIRRVGNPLPGTTQEKYTVLFQADGGGGLPLLEAINFKVYRTSSYLYLKHRFSVLFQQWQKKQEYFRPSCTGILTEILAAVNRELDTQEIHPRQLSVVYRLQTYMMDNMNKKITIQELADLVGLTPNYLIHLFKKVTRQTPIEYLHHVRLSAAQDLLLNKQMTIAEVSETLGYCDPSYFNRMYKKQHGFAPSHLLSPKS